MLIHRIAAQLYTAEALQDIEAALAAGEDATLAISPVSYTHLTLPTTERV